MSTEAPSRDIFELRSPGQMLALGMGVVATAYLFAWALSQFVESSRAVEIVTNLAVLVGLPLLYLRLHDVPAIPALRLHPIRPGQALWIAVAALAVLPPLLVLGQWNQRLAPPPPEYFEMLEKIVPREGPQWVLAVISIAVIAPIGEELVFRGIVQQAARRAAGGIGAAVLAGVLFGVWHGQAWNLASLIALGVLLGLVMEATGSVVACMVLHGLYNLGVLVLYAFGEDLPPLEGAAGAFVATLSLGVAWAAYGRLRRVREWKGTEGPPPRDDDRV